MEVKSFGVERWMNMYEHEAVYNLAETDAKAFTFGELFALGDTSKIIQDILEMKVSYNPTTGSDRLRSLIASQYENTTKNNVLIANGAIEIEFLLSNAIAQPGDTVVVQYPAYQSLYSVAEARGANVKLWEMKLEEGYQPDLNRLRALIDEKTKLLVLNIPNNPTGAVISEDELKTILRWAEEEDFYVLCDEVYHGIAFEEGIIPPYARSLSKKAISVGSMSKSFGLSGLRLGWFAGPEELVQKCWEWKDYTSISNSPLSDYVASFAIEHISQIMERNVSMAQQNRAALENWFRQHEDAIQYTVPKAGMLSFPRFKELLIPTYDFCLRLLREEGVFMVPGECFGFPGHVRIGFGNDPEIFAKGLEITSKFLQKVAAE